MRFRAAFLLLAIALANSACLINVGSREPREPPRRVFFLVPALMPDGSDTAPQREALEQWIVARTGELVVLGQSPWLRRMPTGETLDQPMHAYLATVDRDPDDFVRELHRRIVEGFDQQEAWLERW